MFKLPFLFSILFFVSVSLQVNQVNCQQPTFVFKVQPEKLTEVVVGDFVELKCDIEAVPTPTLSWLKNGNKELNRLKISKNGSLVIHNVREDDAGNYTCSARNMFGSFEGSGEIIVWGNTKFTRKPQPLVTLNAKQSTKLTCEAVTDPKLKLEIIWLFDNRTIDFYSNSRLAQINDNTTLTISNARGTDSGLYTCVARTRLDEIRQSSEVVVNDVPNRPTIESIDCKQLTARVYWKVYSKVHTPINRFILQYSTSFYPGVWEDFNVEVPRETRQFVVSLSPWANYTIRVIAKNDVGNSQPSEPSSTCETSPDKPFDHPKGVSGKGTDKQNMVIKWNVMQQIEHNAPGFFYRISWRPKFSLRDDDSKSVDILDWRKDSYIVNDLPVYEPYWIRVEAHNKYGSAKTRAGEFLGYSGEDVPSKSPQNLRVVGSPKPRSAILEWDPVEKDSVNGEFKGYLIQAWREGDRSSLTEKTVPSNTTRFNFTKLHPSTSNNIVVRVFNGLHKGPRSNELNLKTPEGPPGPVSELHAYAAGSNGLWVAWNTSYENDGPVIGYRLKYRLSNESPRNEKVIDNISPNSYVYKLTKLDSNRIYRIHVDAFNSKGFGPDRFIEESTKDVESVPEIPDFEIEKFIGPDKKPIARVIWKPPIRSGAAGDRFYVKYKKRGEDRYESTNIEESKDYIPIELEPDTMYEVKVVSVADYLHDKERESPSRQLFTGEDDYPAAAYFDWLIFSLFACAILIIFLLMIVLARRSRGREYLVYKKEAKYAGKLNHGDEIGTFNEYAKFDNDAGSRASVVSSIRHADDNESLNDYGDDDSYKIGEDGSFIGEYGKRKSHGNATLV